MKMNLKKWLVGGITTILLGITVSCTLPPWAKTAQAIVETAIPIAGSVISLVDPAVSPLVSLAEAGFTALDNTLKSYEAVPSATNLQAIEAAVAAVQANELQLEAAARIHNTATDTTINNVLALLAVSLNELVALIPANAPVSASMLATSAQAKHTAKGLKAVDIKKLYNADIKGDSRFKGKAFKIGFRKLY